MIQGNSLKFLLIAAVAGTLVLGIYFFKIQKEHSSVDSARSAKIETQWKAISDLGERWRALRQERLAMFKKNIDSQAWYFSPNRKKRVLELIQLASLHDVRALPLRPVRSLYAEISTIVDQEVLQRIPAEKKLSDLSWSSSFERLESDLSLVEMKAFETARILREMQLLSKETSNRINQSEILDYINSYQQ